MGGNRTELIRAAQSDMEREKRILIIDDEQHIIKIIKKTLRKDSYCIDNAKNGLEALKILEKNMPDLIILDMKMPVMNGYEFLGRLKGNVKCVDIPIIILTGYDVDMDKIESIGSTPLEVLHKSGCFDAMAGMIKEFL